MTTNNNKDIEEIINNFNEKFLTTVESGHMGNSPHTITDRRLSNQEAGWLRQALTSYADQRVRDFILKARAKEEGIAELINRGGVDWRDHETRLDLLGKLLFLTHQDNE